jgi:membrane-bound lytic murein transglycosylase D
MPFIKIRYIWIVCVLAVLVSCSHSPKPKLDSPPARIEAPSVSPGSVPAKPQEAPKTIIPEEEKKAAADAEAREKTEPAKSGDNDPAAFLEEALSIYQEAKTCRESGDLDGALKGLDKAFDLMLKAKLPADSPLLQEKNDLRILIAQRIQEIYACRLNPGAASEIGRAHV